MDFVNCEGFGERILLCPGRHPGLILPAIGSECPDDRGCLRAQLRCERIGIGFQDGGVKMT